MFNGLVVLFIIICLAGAALIAFDTIIDYAYYRYNCSLFSKGKMLTPKEKSKFDAAVWQVMQKVKDKFIPYEQMEWLIQEQLLKNQQEQMQPELMQKQMELMEQLKMRILQEQIPDTLASETVAVVNGTAETEINEFADTAASTETGTTAN